MTIQRPFAAALAAVPLAGLTAFAAMQQESETPPEFGDVSWGRKLEDATGASARDGKPVLLLFQEVPG